MFHGVYLLAVVVPVLLALAVARVRRGAPPGRAWLETAFGLYLVFVLVTVLFPLRLSPALRADDVVWDYATFIRDWVNLEPLASVRQVLSYGWPRQAVRQLGGNLVLLFPLGVLMPALFPRFRHAASILALSFASGVGIEALQYLARVARLSLRSVDIDDAILNVAGALIGYSAWRVWAHTRRRLATRRQVAE